MLLKYYSYFIFYSRNEFYTEGFYRIMQYEGFANISGEKSIIERFSRCHHFSQRRDMYLCKLDKPPLYDDRALLDRTVRIGTDNTDFAVDRIIELYDAIDEFDFPRSKEEIKRRFSDKSGRGYYIVEEGKIVSVAQTTAENSASAMVVGVCTHPSYRHKGYASACVARLCDELLNEGKCLCLFYDNPEAGKIYKKLGFYDIGTWSMFSK